MRLTALTLENYGIFQSQRIEFAPAPGRINLLIAPNGAGKSILRNAFCDLLFGIHGQTPMGFRYGYGRMRLMAEAVDPRGRTVSFCRRKGNGNTLIDADRRDARSGGAWPRFSATPTARWSSGCSRWIPNACARAAGNCSPLTVRSPMPCCRPPAGCAMPDNCNSHCWSARRAGAAAARPGTSVLPTARPHDECPAATDRRST